MNKLFFLFNILLFFFAYSCNSAREKPQEKSDNKKQENVQLLNTFFQEIGEKEKTIFRVNYYSNREALLRVEDPKGNLLLETGSSNIELIHSKAKQIAERIPFTPNDSCFIVNFFNKGSTYGANFSVILWYGHNTWNMTALPFDRFEIKDIDKDGFYEILNYDNQTKETYKFNAGYLKSI